MSVRPLVTIIVPMYNVEEYIRTSLRSAMGQTYQEIEILCVNDGSTDHTRNIAQEAISGDVRARIIDQVNKGLSAARNTALSHACGDYVLFLDSDDMLVNTAVESLVGAAEGLGAQIVSSKLSEDAGFGRAVAKGGRVDAPLFVKATLDDFYYQESITNHSCGKLFSRSLFTETGVLFPVGRSYEDIATTYRLMAAASGIASTDASLYYYRPNEDGISHAYTLKNVRDLAIDYEEIRDAFGGTLSNPQRFYLLTILYTLLRLINKTPEQAGLDTIRRQAEQEYDDLFQFQALSFKSNRVFSLKLLLRSTAIGKALLRKWSK